MLKLYWNQDTDQLCASRFAAEAIAGLETKRGSYFQFQLGLHKPGVDALFKIPDAGDLRFVAKASSGAAAAVLAIITNATSGAYDADTGLYTIACVIDSSTLRTLLNFGESPEKTSVTLNGELAWRPDRTIDDDATAEWRATLPFTFKVWNDQERSDGALPATDPPGVFVRADAAQTLTSPQKAQARTNIGLGNVDNTSDANKPVSTAQAAADSAVATAAATDATTKANAAQAAAIAAAATDATTKANAAQAAAIAAAATDATTKANAAQAAAIAAAATDATTKANAAQAAAIAASATAAQGTKADNLAATTPYGAPTSLTYGATLTPDASQGLYRKITLTGNLTINAPTNGTDGMKWKCRLTASGADRTLSFHAAILVPSESSFTSPKTLTSGKTYLVQLEHNGSAWMLQSLIGGY